MNIEYVEGKSGFTEFKKFSKSLYFGNDFYRGTESGIEDLLLNSRSSFHNHSTIKKYLIRDYNQIVGKFALIHDMNLPDYVQVSYFDAVDGIENIIDLIGAEAKKSFPNCPKIVFGLNGHLNYGAGFLLNRFEEAPVFGLPYNLDYYPKYFDKMKARTMVSYRFSMEIYNAWAQTYNSERSMNGLTLRIMDKSQIKKESAIYTFLNNQSFIKHPYWAKRENSEDLELFYPFRFLLKNENLIFAYVNNEPVGFFLWYPDFNKLVSNGRDLNLFDVIKYRLNYQIDTFRFTEIGIIPKFQRSPVALALINKSLPFLLEANFKYCEGGFIFEENFASISFVKRILKRCYGIEPEPYRKYAVYETNLR
jgi:hypothetical protein